MSLSLVVRDGGACFCSDLLENAGVRHAFSTRVGGVSPPPFSSLNLGFGISDKEENVRANWDRLLQSGDMGGMPAVRLEQIHSKSVTVVRQRPAQGVTFHGKGDALLTDLPGVALAITTADCVPVLLAVPGRIVGAVHAGWRGVVSGVLPAALEELSRMARGLDRASIHACMGPHVRSCCFEVGPEVVEQFEKAGLGRPGVIGMPPEGGKARIDLSVALMWQARDAGLEPTNIDVSHHCTKCRPDLFYSYRRDGADRGMLGSVIALPLGR